MFTNIKTTGNVFTRKKINNLVLSGMSVPQKDDTSTNYYYSVTGFLSATQCEPTDYDYEMAIKSGTLDVQLYAINNCGFELTTGLIMKISNIYRRIIVLKYLTDYTIDYKNKTIFFPCPE